MPEELRKEFEALEWVKPIAFRPVMPEDLLPRSTETPPLGR